MFPDKKNFLRIERVQMVNPIGYQREDVMNHTVKAQENKGVMVWDPQRQEFLKEYSYIELQASTENENVVFFAVNLSGF